jgi:hypothetical protein
MKKIILSEDTKCPFDIIENVQTGEFEAIEIWHEGEVKAYIVPAHYIQDLHHEVL